MPSGKKDQYEEMASLYKSGMTLRQVGQQFGVSGEWVRQVISARGVTRTMGGKSASVKKAKDARMAERDKRCLEKYGCTAAQFESTKGDHKHGCKAPLYAFNRQRAHAAERRVGWKLTFWEWWVIWRDSGLWGQRGRGLAGFVMCRNGDAGIYETGNVYIGSAVANSVEGKTLSLERGGNNTLVYRAMKAAGGRKAVSEALGYPAHYISQVCCRGSIPQTWEARGLVDVLASMTNGAFKTADLLAAVRCSGGAD